jgi:hypothetical protein
MQSLESVAVSAEYCQSVRSESPSRECTDLRIADATN